MTYQICVLAKQTEAELKPFWQGCKDAFSECTKAESSSVKYMAECYTSLVRLNISNTYYIRVRIYQNLTG